MTYILVITLVFYILIKYPRSYAWLFVYFISNPGGIASTYLSKANIGGFSYVDIFFFLAFATIFIGKYNIRDFFNNKDAIRIFIILLVFSLYKALVWGLIIPDPSFEDYFRYCIVRERDAIFGFLFIIPAYLFAMKDLKYLLKIMAVLGVLIITLSIITILFGNDLIQIMQFERYEGSNIIRYILQGYTFLILLIPASIAVFLGKLRVVNKKLLLVGGIFAVILIIISLTKGLYISILGSSVSAIYFTLKILKLSFPKGIQKVTIFVSIVIFVLAIIFPRYSDYARKSASDIFLLATEGVTSEGEASRYWQVPAFMHEIKANPLIGTGQGYKQLSKEFDINQFDATDLPLLAHIMQYGLIGIGIYLIYYFKLFQLMLSTYKYLKRVDKYLLMSRYKYEFIFIIAITGYFIGYFLRTYQIFIELTKGTERIYMSIFTGILLACIQKIRYDQFAVSNNILNLETENHNG